MLEPVLSALTPIAITIEMTRLFWVLCFLASVANATRAGSDEPTPVDVERGRVGVHSPWNPPFWSPRAYQEAWKRWGLTERPAEYARAFRERYGLHEAPFDNDGLPMGLVRTRGLLGIGQGLGNDCLLCHSGTVAGQTIIGLGNNALDLQSLYEDLYAADGLPPTTPLPVSVTRGTNEASNFAVYLMQFRDADLRTRIPASFPMCPNLCEDVPPWWHLRKKQTIYHMGIADSRSVRTLMPFLLIPGNSAATIKRHESDFSAIQAYLRSLTPPRYPFPINAPLAAKGKTVFERTCARCHGTYGPEGRYPNKIVPLDVIGTDRTLAQGFSSDAVRHYLSSWFAQETGPDGKPYHGLNGGGYQAPPLDGIWASAPYFHNGSVPTVSQVLNSPERPEIFTRTYTGDEAEYDPQNLGLRVKVLTTAPSNEAPPIERRKVYDTRKPGRSNAGHTFGDTLEPAERKAVVEYLKTL